MQNLKNKLINKINDSLVGGGTSSSYVQSSSLLNVFNPTVVGGGSQNTSDATTTRSSDNSTNYLNDSEDDKLIQLFEDEDNPDISSVDLVLSNQVVNETNLLGRVQQLANKSNANRFNSRKQENNNYSKELNDTHSHNQQQSTTRHHSKNSILVDIGLVSDLDSALDQTESAELKRFKKSLNPSRRYQTSSTYASHRTSHSDDNNDDDVPMLNPNYDRSHEDQATTVIMVDERRGVQDQLLASDHCHIPENMVDKKRHDIVWRKLIIVLILCIIFMVAEIVGGILANAIAIQTDAAHMAADIAGFAFSILAIYISTKQPTKRMSYGYHRSEILGALCSTLVIWILTAVLVYLAIERTISNKFELEPVPMLVTASCGVVFNIIMYVVLHTNICFKGINLGHHGHSHSGDGHGHSHSGGGAHGHSHSHGHSHKKGNDGHQHSHHSGEHGAQPSRSHSGSTSSGHNHYGALKSVDPVDHQVVVSDTMPITDNYALGSKVDCDHEPIVVDEVELADQVNDGSNINLRAAAIHVIGDFVQSIGVLIAAIFIYIDKDKFKLADPICTFIFSALVILTTAPILRDIYYVLMEALPGNVNYESVMQDLCKIPQVNRAHNLHIWCLTMEKIALSVHLVTDKDADTQEVLRLANQMLRTKYKIEKTTIQVEFFAESMNSCSQCQPLLK